MAEVPRKLLIVQAPGKREFNIMMELTNQRTMTAQVPEPIGVKAITAAQSAVLDVLVQTGFASPRIGGRP